jgi:hypothetical protein
MSIPAIPGDGPGFWMYETSGVLAPVVKAYLEDRPLSEADIRILKAYLRQWIFSGVWDRNPTMDDEGRRDLTRLRVAAALIRTRKDVDRWIDEAIGFGVDPL